MTGGLSVFVAHWHGDAPFVLALEQHLLHRKRWRLSYIMEPDNNWFDKASCEIAGSFAVAFVLTKKSLRSSYCKIEWQLALEHRKPLLLIDLDDVAKVEYPEQLTTVRRLGADRNEPDQAARVLHAELQRLM